MIEAGGAGTAPMVWSGGMGWIADFPDPSNFYGPNRGCAGAAEGGWNWSKFCDEALDAKAIEADAGEILLRGEPIDGPGKDRGLVFQSYSLFPWLTVEQNVALAVDAVHKDRGAPERRALVRQLCSPPAGASSGH